MANNANSKFFSVSTSKSQIDAMFEGLEEDIYVATRKGAFAGSDVIYKQVLQNVNAIGKVTGNLAGAIYQKFSPEQSVPAGNNTYKVASYNISWRVGGKNSDGGKGEPVAGGLNRAPHGGLVEYGHVQYYQAFIDKNGDWKTAIRPEMMGKPKPKRRASRAEKDAYYVPRKGGPQIIAAKPFMRNAAATSFDNAARAMEQAFVSELTSRGVIK